MDSATGRSDSTFGNVNSSPFSSATETVLTKILHNNHKPPNSKRETSAKRQTIVKADFSDSEASLSEFEYQNSISSATAGDSDNENSLNRHLTFLNDVSITCPGCSEPIKPIFIPFQPHNQTGSGNKQKLPLFSPIIQNSQFGAGKKKQTKRKKSSTKKKPVKRVNKSKPKKKKRGTTKKSGSSRRGRRH